MGITIEGDFYPGFCTPAPVVVRSWAVPLQLGASTKLMKFNVSRWRKPLGIFIWLTIIVSYILYTEANRLAPIDAIQQLVHVATSSPLGPLIYFVTYLLRPLVFFPAVLLSLAVGYMFGPVLGVFYTIIASNASSMVAYGVGRYFGGECCIRQSQTN